MTFMKIENYPPSVEIQEFRLFYLVIKMQIDKQMFSKNDVVKALTIYYKIIFGVNKWHIKMNMIHFHIDANWKKLSVFTPSSSRFQWYTNYLKLICVKYIEETCCEKAWVCFDIKNCFAHIYYKLITLSSGAQK